MIANGLFKKSLKLILQFVPTVFLRRHILILCGYKVGKEVYIPASLKISDLKSRNNNLIIGDRVSFGPNVLIITDSSPNNSKLLKLFPMVSKKVIVEEDAWIGANVVLMPGVTIGRCSVIGTGSIVTKSIPAYSIAFGVPAKVIKKINSEDL